MENIQPSKLRLITFSHDASEVRFEQVILHHLDALYRTALRLTRRKEDAEDLLQETLLKALKKFHQLADQSKVRAWLFQILVNNFYNNKKREKREPPIVDVDLNEDLLVSSLEMPQYNPFEAFGKLLSDEVEQALDRLHPEFQIVVLLADVEGLSYDEITKLCHCSMGTVASRLYRARELLRISLEEYAKKHGYLS